MQMHHPTPMSRDSPDSLGPTTAAGLSSDSIACPDLGKLLQDASNQALASHRAVMLPETPFTPADVLPRKKE